MTTAVRLLGYQKHWRDKQFLYSLGQGSVLLAASLVVTVWAITYATAASSNPVTDIILSNIRVVDVDSLFVYGPVAYWVITGLYLLLHPHKLPFAAKSLALFLFIRSVFISLTHIGIFPTHIPVESSGWLSIFMSGNDLFFSGHTGLPFLLALVLWEDRAMRWFSLAAAVFFGVIVLLGHLHYSIDVLAAFFITYTIFHLSQKLFKRDCRLALNPQSSIGVFNHQAL